MPKRKKCSDGEYSHLLKKMKKLERKILRGCRRRSDSSSSAPSDDHVAWNNVQDDEIIEIETCADEGSYFIEPMPSTSAAADEADAAYAAACAAASASVPCADAAPTTSSDDTCLAAVSAPGLGVDAHTNAQSEQIPLDEEILAILGNDPTAPKSYGENIHKDLTVRFEHIATTGLTKESRSELRTKYLPPANCVLIDAPTLNPELKAAVSDLVSKRDAGIEIKQKQVANAISCIGQAITRLLSSEDKNTDLIKLLMDANRILCDCQYLDSYTRRNFLLSVLKKDMKEQLQTTKIDRFLFGKDFAETLKSAKAISKTGAELKGNTTPRPAVKKTKPTANRNLNWRAPPQNRRHLGPQRNQPPASQKNRRAPFTGTSRPPPPPPNQAQSRNQR